MDPIRMALRRGLFGFGYIILVYQYFIDKNTARQVFSTKATSVMRYSSHKKYAVLHAA